MAIIPSTVFDWLARNNNHVIVCMLTCNQQRCLEETTHMNRHGHFVLVLKLMVEMAYGENTYIIY